MALTDKIVVGSIIAVVLLVLYNNFMTQSIIQTQMIELKNFQNEFNNKLLNQQNINNNENENKENNENNQNNENFAELKEIIEKQQNTIDEISLQITNLNYFIDTKTITKEIMIEDCQQPIAVEPHSITKMNEPRTIYDTFVLGHELDWLEIRFHELDNVVDYFVIVESNISFSGEDKELYWDQYKKEERFKPFVDKIIHVLCPELAEVENTEHEWVKLLKDMGQFEPHWIREALSRMCIKKGLTNAKEDHIILHGDIDELPRSSYLNLLKWYNPVISKIPARITHAFYYYNFNWKFNYLRPGTTIMYASEVLSPTWNPTIKPDSTIENVGWHCSSCLSVEDIIQKLQTFSHVEFDTPEITDPKHIQECIDKGLDFAGRSDNVFYENTDSVGDIPQYILDNLDRFGFMVPLSKYPNILELAKKYNGI